MDAATNATATTPSATRAWRGVLESIESDLLEGRLNPGDRLPPERELAAQLGVGRSSVREALRVLDVLGLVRTATGSGPSSGAIIIATPQGGMSALLRLQVAAQGFPLADVVRTRLLLETAVVDDVARAEVPDLGPASVALAAMDVAGLTPDEFLALDAQFHLALAEASGNAVVAAMMAGLRTSIEGYVRTGAASIADWQGTMTRLRAEHRAIVAAIERHDADEARGLVHEHITQYYSQSQIAAATPAPATTTHLNSRPGA